MCGVSPVRLREKKPLVSEAVHAYVVLDGTLIPVDRSLGMPVSSLGGGAPGSAFPVGPVWRLGQDRGDQECERVMDAGCPLGACTRPRPTSWTTAMP